MQARGWLVASVLMVFTVMVEAYPIPPQPLRKLTAESDLVVVARVTSVTQEKRQSKEDGEFDFGTAMARLQILQVVKGNYSEQFANVYYSQAIICPAPPHYEPSETVLAFLRSDEDTKGYYTVGLSWGAKSMSLETAEIYVACIQELLRLEAQSDPITRQQQLIEWFVRCAEHPATRWEGAYELFLGREMRRWQQETAERGQARGVTERGGVAEDESTAFEVLEKKIISAETGEEVTDFAALLNAEQKQRLLQALYRSPRIEHGELSLIELVAEWKDENLLPFLWSYLKAHKPDDPSITETLLEYIAKTYDNTETQALVERYRRATYTLWDSEKPPSPEARRQLLDEFIRLIESLGPPRLIEIYDEPPPSSVPANSTDWVRKFSLAGLLIGVRLVLATMAYAAI